MNRPFAVFDIDGTIFRSSLFLEMLYQAVEEAVLPKAIEQDASKSYETWLKRKNSTAYDEYIKSAVNSFEKNLAGVDAAELQRIAKIVVDRYHEHTYVYTRDLLKFLKNKGYFLIAITGSLEEVALEFTRHYNFDYVKATTLQTENGKYTGAYSLADKDKHLSLKQIIKDFRLTSKDSYGVGDSGGDISMLEVVENPIAFNPDKTLFKKAQEMGWQIVVERKNMIYQMEQKDGLYLLAKTNV